MTTRRSPAAGAGDRAGVENAGSGFDVSKIPADSDKVVLDAALDYAANGWAILPLRGKIPLTAHGVDDATSDLDVIRSWWSRWPAANVGARVPEQLLVLDVDPRNGGDLDLLDAPLPETLTCWSGRGDGGAHYYFLQPAGALTSTRLPAGIDLKLRGYCVVPPSVHPATGRPYRWQEHEIAPVPAWLRSLLRPAPKPIVVLGPRRSGDGRHLVDFVALQQLGNVNNALYWAACRAADDNLLADLVDDLVAAAVAAGHPEPGARRTVESAAKRVVV
jgi:hypothetical protein